MEDGTENGEIVRTVIALAKTLKLDVIAEGIETIHQLHQLRILGCEYGQGYLFSRPVSVADAEKLITDKFRWESIIPKSNFVPAMQNTEFTQIIFDWLNDEISNSEFLRCEYFRLFSERKFIFINVR